MKGQRVIAQIYRRSRTRRTSGFCHHSPHQSQRQFTSASTRQRLCGFGTTRTAAISVNNNKINTNSNVMNNNYKRKLQFLSTTTAAVEDENIMNKISGVTLNKNGNRNQSISVMFQDGLEEEFHLCWLRDNCQCPQCMTESGQKIKDNQIYPESPALEFQSIDTSSNDEQIIISWSDHEDKTAVFDAKWLRKHAYGQVESESLERNASSETSDELRKRHGKIPQIEYDQVTSKSNDKEGLWNWMTQMNDAGFSLIKNAPLEDGIVRKVANLVGPTSHNIYGDIFDVKVDPQPINIAYSDAALEPHMDLAYYEDPPGVQMLHCLDFGEKIVGGMSTLIDAHAVAETLKERDPIAFHNLATIPATFQKDHSNRENPVKMFYQRPHISTNYLGQVTSVFWSPPFEGPLRVASHLVEPYYQAYNAFRELLLSQEMSEKYGVVFRLVPGDLLTFNNRRMLHGRTAFESQNGARHLQGCYLEVDNYLLKYRILASEKNQQDGCVGAVEEMRFGTTSHR